MDLSDLGGGDLVGSFTADRLGLAWDLTQICKFFSRTNTGVANDHAEDDILDRGRASGLPLLEPRGSRCHYQDGIHIGQRTYEWR